MIYCSLTSSFSNDMNFQLKIVEYNKLRIMQAINEQHNLLCFKRKYFLSDQLAEHAMAFHNNMNVNIADVNLEILKRYTSPLEARLMAEATLIDRFIPQINSKHERI